VQPAGLWIPLGINEAAVQQPPGARYLLAVGRAKPGVTRAQIDADLGSVSEPFARELPATQIAWSGETTPLREQLSSAERKPVVASLVLVGFLLLLGLGCVCGAGTTRITPPISSSHGRPIARLLAERPEPGVRPPFHLAERVSATVVTSASAGRNAAPPELVSLRRSRDTRVAERVLWRALRGCTPGPE